MGEHSGHRQRMIERMKRTVLPEHELLEVLLYNALPRRNTNDLAHKLLSEFKTMNNIFNASMERLMQVEGIGESVAAYLCTVGGVFRQVIENYRDAYPETFETKTFLPFVKNKYRDLDKEVLDIYYLSPNNRITATRRFTSSEDVRVQFDAPAFAATLLQEKPAGIVIVHNHPYGKCKPSEADDNMTKQCEALCSMQNILLCDHIVYGNNGTYSYYEEGRMQSISQAFSMDKICLKEKS